MNAAQDGMPWFCRTFPHEVGEDINVRLCGGQVASNEDVYMELPEVYMQWMYESCVQKQYKG